jgi:hypothetical protein
MESTTNLNSGAKAPGDGARTLPPADLKRSPLEEIEAGRPVFEVALEWANENRTVAMIGAFAVGSLIGAMLRR